MEANILVLIDQTVLTKKNISFQTIEYCTISLQLMKISLMEYNELSTWSEDSTRSQLGVCILKIKLLIVSSSRLKRNWHQRPVVLHKTSRFSVLINSCTSEEAPTHYSQDVVLGFWQDVNARMDMVTLSIETALMSGSTCHATIWQIHGNLVSHLHA